MVKTRFYLTIVSILIFLLLVTSIALFHYHAYLLLSLIIIAIIMIPFFVRFEWRQLTGREIVILAILAAIAAVGRVPFAGLPSVQPTSFVIIITGLVFGSESGFIVGATAAIVSNIFLGQGPWTPWQMYAWGMMGMSAGLLSRSKWLHNRYGLSVFGFAWGYVFGWFMNLWIIVTYLENMTWSIFWATYISSIYHDLAHALSNVFFLILFSTAWIKILKRAKLKYDLFSNTMAKENIKQT